MSNFIGVYEGGASVDYCERMISRLEDLLAHSAGTHFGAEDNGGMRNRYDFARFFERDDTDLAMETYDILNKNMELYQAEYPALAIHQVYSVSVKVQKTPPKGGFHSWHSEQAPSGPDSPRALVWMIYLNDTPDGEGTTEFLEQGVRLQPKQGTVVFFPAAWTHTHRGNPVYAHDKYIATGWYNLIRFNNPE